MFTLLLLILDLKQAEDKCARFIFQKKQTPIFLANILNRFQRVQVLLVFLNVYLQTNLNIFNIAEVYINRSEKN